MANNLKLDLSNQLGNEKYYLEMELARLASHPNMAYKEKVDKLISTLKELADNDLAQQLVGKYFMDEAPKQAPVDEKVVPAPAPEQATNPAPTNGQSHAE